MKIAPDLHNTIKTFLSLIMGKDEAEEFAGIDRALAFIERRSHCWQAATSVGVHVSVLCGYIEPDSANEALHEIIDCALKPLEEILDSVVSDTQAQSIEDERERVLFHTRFGLGLTLLAYSRLKSDLEIEEQAINLLHEMAGTQLTLRGEEVRSGLGIVKYYRDMAYAKLYTVLSLLLIYPYEESQNYGEILYHINETLPYITAAPWQNLLIKEGYEVLEGWTEKCEVEDARREFDFPTLEWLDLFAEAAETLSLCQEADVEGDLPSKCKPESAQFLAWKFGQIVSRFVAPDSRWHDDAFGQFSGFWRAGHMVVDVFELRRGQEKALQALTAVLSLLCEYAPSRDWEKIQQQYVSMWELSNRYCGIALAETNPHTDLYWAARIGFADKVLATTPRGAVIKSPGAPPPVIRDIEMMKDIASTIALRQLKHEQRLDRMLERLPPTKREIQQWLQQKLGAVWDELPAKVVHILVKAENYYRSGVNDDDAKVWFHKAVEASFDCCIVEPLVNWIQKRGDIQIAVCFPPPRGIERMSSGKLHKLSPREWSAVLDTLAASPRKDLASLGTKNLKEFMEAHLGGPYLPDLRSLARSLRMVHQLRKGSAHYQEALSRYEKEQWELEQMRNLVLGINEPSVITQIFQLLSAKKQP